MADTFNFDSLLNTTAGMTAVVNNAKHDDDVVSVTGVDWFTYAGKTASTIYVSGNNFIGFGQNAEQLKIWRRDGAIYYIYRQEGTLTSGKRFLKIRVEGYVYYSSTSSSYALKYEVFLIEGQTLFINVVQRPTSSSYTGTSSITDGKTTTSLNISVSSTVPISILVKNAGSAQEVSYEKYSDISITGISVTTLPNKTTYYQKELFDSTGMIVTATTNVGSTVEISDYEVSGFDSSSAGTKTITVTASGKTTTFDITVSEASITAISVTTMPSKVNYHIGKEFDSTGIVVTATTSDGNTVTLNSDQLEYSGFDSSSPKTNTITVSYGTLTTTFDVTIMQPERITGTSYSAGMYFIGDTTNASVSRITVAYSDGSEQVTSGYTINNTVATEAGLLPIMVEYFGITTTITVNILDSFSVRIGTPNKADVTAIFDLETNILDVSGTGEFNNNLSDNAEGITCPNSLYTRCKQIIFNDGITKIPGSFGYSFSNLENLVLGNSIAEIGGGNFSKYLGTSLTFPESLVKMEGGCFSSCPNLTELIFHEGFEEMGGGTFYDCPSLKNLVLPTTLKSMPYCFQGDTLENLEIGGEDVVFASSGSGGTIYNVSAKNLVIRGGTICSNVFGGKNIETLTLNGTVKWNGTNQFSGCSKLKTLSIGNGIVSFPASCFSGCGILNNVVIPDSVAEIGEYTFNGCTSLNSIRLSKNIKKIPDCCFNGCGFETFIISDDLAIEELGNALFQYCSNLKTVYIGKNVKTIASSAFSGTSGITIKINQTEDSISGSPWSASNSTVEWVEVQLVKIEVTSLPSKLKYKKDETFDSSGLIVQATYDDGRVEETTSYTLSSPDMSTAGTKTITVTYETQTTTFSITVIEITNIEITAPPTRTEYQKGGALDTTGMIVSTIWTDGSKEVLADGYAVSELDSTETGEKTITVTYQTFTATFTVEVVADTAGIRISHYPNKVYYKIGESLDTTGLTVAKYRADGTEVEITGYTVSDLDSSTSGSKTVNVFYTEAISSTESETFNTDFQVRVTKDGKNPFDDSSSGGSGGGSGDIEEEKTEEIKVTVHWINGEFADLTNENIDQNTLTLQESICSEQYFIFGGCVCNQITFQAHHDQFNGTSEEFYPSGKIEVYIERKGTKIKIFTGEIDSAERKANSLTRNFIAYDYLYKLRNTDIARWYKNQTTDKKKKLTQKQFRDKLFEFLGLEQVSTKLHWDDTYVPDTNNSNEMNVVNILKDLCLQNDRFGWMNRDGKFEYLKLRQNSYRYGQTTDNQNIYKYYNNEEVHLDTFKSFTAKEGRIWFPNVIFCDPDPNRAFGFTQGDYTAQEAYDNNVYYNRNSFFVGNEDWLNYVWNADEYGGISRVEPIMKICYGVFVDQDLRKYYRAQGYTAEVQGNPLNMVGQAVELYYKKQIQHDDQEPTELQWYVHSYIMSRTLKIGITDLIDTYSANNAPFNSNSQQLGKYTPEVSATVNKTRSELPTISYEEFTDGSDFSAQSAEEAVKKAQLRCLKKIDQDKYKSLVSAGSDRADTIYFTFKKSGSTTTYAAFANRQEIEDFPINGVDTDAIYGGNVLFWRKGGFRINRNVADEAIGDVCTCKSGHQFFRLLYCSGDTKASDYIATFSETGDLFKKIRNIKQNNAVWTLAYGSYFHIMTASLDETKIMSFYQFSEDGTLISTYDYNKTANLYNGTSGRVKGFYIDQYGRYCVVVFYYGRKVYMQTQIVLPNGGSSMVKNENFKYAPTLFVKEQFHIGDKIIGISGSRYSSGSTVGSSKPILLDLTSYKLQAISEKYIYLGTDGSRIFCTDLSEQKIYEYTGDEFEFKYDLSNDFDSNWTFLRRITFADGYMIAQITNMGSTTPNADYIKIIRIDSEFKNAETVSYEVDNIDGFLVEREMDGIASYDGKLYIGKNYWKASSASSSTKGAGAYTDEISF